jgi:uncharacterized protein YecE (DUF72 family)
VTHPLPANPPIDPSIPPPQIQRPAFQLGLAVWSFPGWIGDFYPKGSTSKTFLDLYGQRFTTVEGNTTFYSIPSPETIARWVDRTPSPFEFCLKLHRDITHAGLLVPQIEPARRFYETIAGLGDRLGVSFLQLPPRYGPASLGDLEAFLTAWPRDRAPIAVEVRHPAWFQAVRANPLNALLDRLHVGRVLLDTRPIYSTEDDPQKHSKRKKPQLPLQPIAIGDYAFVRFISHPEFAVNLPFLREWVDRVGDWLAAGKRVYFFVHCPIEEHSPHTARRFHALLIEAGIDLPPLDWPAIAEPIVEPSQLSLF